MGRRGSFKGDWGKVDEGWVESGKGGALGVGDREMSLKDNCFNICKSVQTTKKFKCISRISLIKCSRFTTCIISPYVLVAARPVRYVVLHKLHKLQDVKGCLYSPTYMIVVVLNCCVYLFAAFIHYQGALNAYKYVCEGHCCPHKLSPLPLELQLRYVCFSYLFIAWVV